MTIYVMEFLNINNKKLTEKFTLIFKRTVFFFGLMYIAISFPSTTNAGVFSFLIGETNEKVSAKVIDGSSSSNSQNMLVLQASVNRDPNPNKSTGEGPLMSRNALVAEIGPSGTASDVDQEATNTQISLYVVHEGDTLMKIANMFKVSVNTIMWANDLDRGEELKEGQKLIILPISGIKYTVKKGDTIRGIVSKYQSDLNEVLQFNGLTLSSMISPGDVIVIPDAEPTTVQTQGIFNTKKVVVSPVLHGADGPYYPGYFIRPVDIGYKSQGLHGYNAVDIAVPIGTVIHAAAEGTVIASAMGGWHGGYGNYVIISHPNGTQTLYAHTSKNFVRVGDHVEQGQMIAKSGSTGNSTGPHLHVEVRNGKNPF
jgi:LysM repeat protein